MKKELLDLLKKAKPVFGPIHREAVNLSWILEIHSSSLQTGFYVFQSLEQTHFLPMVDGALWGNLPEYFEMLSFYKSTKNFLIHNFQLPVSPDIPLCKGEPIWVNLESLSFNIKEFFGKLEHFATTGFVEVEDRVKREKGYIFLQNGLIVDAKIKQHRGEEALKQIINSLSENVCMINLYQLEDITLGFLLSDPKVVSVSWNLEDAQDFCQELSRRHMGLPTLLVSVSMQDYGYRVFMDGYVIYQASFDEEADVFEVHLVSQIKQFDILNPYDYIEEGSKIKILKSDDRSTIIYFCPACWSVISEKDKLCPNCGYDLTDFHNMPYEYKLLMGLEHPVVEMRINVIHTVGMKNLISALPQLEHMANKESNPMLLMAIVDALGRMSHPEAIELLRKLSNHTYPVIRSRARYMLDKKFTHKT
jgi:hypothetical protein